MTEKLTILIKEEAMEQLFDDYMISPSEFGRELAILVSAEAQKQVDAWFAQQAAEKPSEPIFEVGKRYWSRNGHQALVTDVYEDGSCHAVVAGVRRYWHSGGFFFGSKKESVYDLLPGAIDDSVPTGTSEQENEDWKARAEKAEAALKKADAALQNIAEYLTRCPKHACFDYIVEITGLTVIPAKVVWGNGDE